MAIQSYVVYMGSPSGGGGVGDLEAVQAGHLQMLSSVVTGDEQGRVALTQSYHHAFEGFATKLTEEEASALSGEAPPDASSIPWSHVGLFLENLLISFFFSKSFAGRIVSFFAMMATWFGWTDLSDR